MVRARSAARPSKCMEPCSALICAAMSVSCCSMAELSAGCSVVRLPAGSAAGKSNSCGCANSSSSACCRAVISASASSTPSLGAVSLVSAGAAGLLRPRRSSWRSMRAMASARRALRISSVAAETAACRAAGIVARQAVDPPFQFVDLAGDGSDVVVGRRLHRLAGIARGNGVVRGRRSGASGRGVLVRRLDDERVQPGADGNPGTPCRLARDVARVGMNAFDVPRHGSHAHSGVFGLQTHGLTRATPVPLHNDDAAWT